MPPPLTVVSRGLLTLLEPDCLPAPAACYAAFGYSGTRIGIPRSHSPQVDATTRSGDPAQTSPGHSNSGFALVMMEIEEVPVQILYGELP
jgi:hypothetical protein